MISKQATRLIAAIGSTLVLAACASTTSGAGTQGTDVPTTSASTAGAPPTTGSTSSSTPAPSGSATTVSGFPTDPAGLGALLSTGMQSIKSAHMDLTENAGGQVVTGTGDELLSNGKTTAIDFTETIPGAGTVRYLIIGTTVFAQLPSTIYKSSKPWVEITAATANSVLKALYTSFESSTQAGAGDTVGVFVAAAKNLTLHGTGTFDGDTVAHYSLAVDIASLPADFPNRAALVQSGLKSIPINLDVDTHGRTRKVTEDLTVSGQHVTVDVSLTKIDAPVSIKAPPADQVEQP